MRVAPPFQKRIHALGIGIDNRIRHAGDEPLGELLGFEFHLSSVGPSRVVPAERLAKRVSLSLPRTSARLACHQRSRAIEANTSAANAARDHRRNLRADCDKFP